MYARLVARSSSLGLQTPSSNLLIVSSSARLGKLEEHFREVGQPGIIVSLAEIVYLLSLLPEVKIGIGGMKTFLFETTGRRFGSQLERTILRVIKTSREVDLPWARKSQLMREVRSGLLQNASSEGRRESMGDLEEKALESDAIPRTAEILREALDRSVAEMRPKREHEDLERRAQRLERELDAMRSRLARVRR